MLISRVAISTVLDTGSLSEWDSSLSSLLIGGGRANGADTPFVSARSRSVHQRDRYRYILTDEGYAAGRQVGAPAAVAQG